MVEWTKWLCNELLPWAAYRAMMGARLVALDKEPGTCLLGVGEYLRQGFAKFTLKGCGDDTKTACGSTQLCDVLEAGIEGALHDVALRAVEYDTMEFGEWEVDDLI